MRVDLDTEDINLETLPRFQRASFYAQGLLTLAAWLGGLALGILLAALWVPDTVWRPLLCNCGAALLLLAAGLQSAWWVAYWRCAARARHCLAPLAEAIHPPAGAANAYHAVQAAQITVKAMSARERGRAADQTNMAQLQASMAKDKAMAAAREARAGAEAAGRRFAAEQQAYRRAGQAFLLEQYFSQLGQGLANARAVILDHRLGGGNAPTIDLRNYAPPIDSVAPSKAGQ